MKLIEKFKDKENIKNLFLFLVGLFILAFNYNVFILPNNFNVGGLTGIASMFNYLCGINPSYFIFVGSIILVILSFFTLDKLITYNSVIGAILYPLMIEFVRPLASIAAPYLEFSNIVIIIIVAGFLLGCGTGLVYKSKYTTGGSDIIVNILHRYQHLTLGNSQFIMNFVIISLGCLVFGFASCIYSILIILISTNIVDKIIIGISNSKMFMVSSKKYKDIQNYVLKNMNTGVTVLSSSGGFLLERKKMLMIVVPTRDYTALKERILEIDEDAFIVVNDCYEVTGGRRRKHLL